MKKFLLSLSVLFFVSSVLAAQNTAEHSFVSIELFPPANEHVHGATIVECPNGDLLAAWFQGSGERWADDAVIRGARLKKGDNFWGDSFVLADAPGFPDINPVLFFDPENNLWLVWYTVIANQWDTSLLKYRISSNYATAEAPPRWKWQEVLHVKPGNKAEHGIQHGDRFVESIERKIREYTDYLENELHSPKAVLHQFKKKADSILSGARGEDMIRRGYLIKKNGEAIPSMMGYPYFRRMGWQTKNKPFITKTGRIILPLYSDGFGFSIMAITDDLGANWRFSEPLVGAGNIQPAVAKKRDGTLVAYMRDSGPPPRRLQMCFSKDRGVTWSTVKDSRLPNPGSGSDIVTLANGNWVLANNDLEKGRHSLAVYLSTNEGTSWDFIRHLEVDSSEQNPTRFAYPSIIQGRDGSVHVVYSVHPLDGRGETIKYARFNEEWIVAGDEGS